MNHFTQLTLSGLLLLALAGLSACRSSVPSAAAKPGTAQQSSGPESGPQSAQKRPETTSANPVEIPLAGLQGVQFITVAVPRAESRWSPGEAIGDESAQALLTAPVTGIISSPPAQPGRHVTKGAALLTLQSPELAELKARWLQAQARLIRVETDLAREERLAAANATSLRDLELARSEAAAVRVEREAARINLQARGVSPGAAGSALVIRAPATGSVIAWDIQLGQGVVSGQRLGSFQSHDAALARIELPLPGPEWRVGAETAVRSASGEKWRGRVEGIPSALTADTRRLIYRLRLSGGTMPLPGSSLEAQVPFAASLVLPQEALQQVEGEWGVFLKNGPTASFRPVQRGEEIGDAVLVLSGVKPGETVATSGAFLLKSLLLKIKNAGEENE